MDFDRRIGNYMTLMIVKQYEPVFEKKEISNNGMFFAPSNVTFVKQT
jgi:hypothetical protein